MGVTDMSRARKFNDTRIFNHHGGFYKGALLLKRTTKNSTSHPCNPQNSQARFLIPT